MWYVVRLDSNRVATLIKVKSATRVSSSDPTRVNSNYIPVYTTILRQIERCHRGHSTSAFGANPHTQCNLVVFLFILFIKYNIGHFIYVWYVHVCSVM